MLNCNFIGINVDVKEDFISGVSTIGKRTIAGALLN